MEFTSKLEAAQYTLTCTVQAREVQRCLEMDLEVEEHCVAGTAAASVQVTG